MLRRLCSILAERTSALLQRWTQVFLHQSHPSGWERKVLPHLHVYLPGKNPHKCPVFALASALTFAFIPAQHEHGHPSVPDLRRLGCHQNPGLQPRKEPHVGCFQDSHCIIKLCAAPSRCPDVFQILPEHRGRPQKTPPVQVTIDDHV